METNIKIKEKGVIAKPTPQSPKQDTCESDCILSPKRIKAIIASPDVVVTAATDPTELSINLQKIIDIYVKNNGLKLDDVKFSTTPMPESDTMNPHVEYSALLIFKKE